MMDQYSGSEDSKREDFEDLQNLQVLRRYVGHKDFPTQYNGCMF